MITMTGTLLALPIAMLAMALPAAAAAQDPATRPGDDDAEAPRAAVLEHADKQTGGYTGAAKLLAEAGWEVKPLDTKRPATEQNVDLIVLGSFAASSDTYRDFMKAHGSSLAQFVETGGTVVQFTQSVDDEAALPFLPEAASVDRSGEHHQQMFVLKPALPLFRGMMLAMSNPPQLQVPRHLSRDPALGTLYPAPGAKGCTVVIAADRDGKQAVLLEVAHGEGRYLLTTLFLDKLYDPQGATDAPEMFETIARAFFKNLAAYIG